MKFHRELAKAIVDEVFPQWSSSEKGAAMRLMQPVLKRHLKCLTEDIVEFHEKFGLEYDDVPRNLPDDMSEFRIKFMQEELDEYKEGADEGDLAKQFDALIDLVYVALGTSYLQGFPFADGWAEVQRANMSKIRVERPEESKRGSKYDVVKPEGWVGPNHTQILWKAATGQDQS